MRFDETNSGVLNIAPDGNIKHYQTKSGEKHLDLENKIAQELNIETTYFQNQLIAGQIIAENGHTNIQYFSDNLILFLPEMLSELQSLSLEKIIINNPNHHYYFLTSEDCIDNLTSTEAIFQLNNYKMMTNEVISLNRTIK